ncbi:cytochrome c oxidase subunit 3 [Oligoflexus tunisiensis]|uniref:cytochrome c oxidase subunit 3 n=1 Tax=Oligoflexus tunisiensis TaxID=708132 RepID=UPI00114D08A0|nr:cytochrome c oxidase subunit 3 [Oligoflexus tunisiensis]
MAQTMSLPTGSRSSRKAAFPNSVLGMLIFVTTEVMFFLALVSSHTVIKSTAGIWSPPESVRLPLLATGFNTLVLLSSGLLLYLAGRNFGKDKARTFFALSIVTGLFFVTSQGYEWLQLIRYGLTMTSGVFGATFFLLVGSHGLHAASGVVALMIVYRLMSRGRINRDQFKALQIFWFFIVAIWPLFYAVVYF